MPNWSTNSYAVKGNKNEVSKFITLGLTNCGLTPTGDLKQDFDLLMNEGFSIEGVAPNDFNLPKEERAKLTPSKIMGVSMHTFRPMPESFTKYDTTNFRDILPEIAAEQEREYGCVGWYDWNNKYIGTKWNAKMNMTYQEEEDGTVTIYWDNQTAWCAPLEFLGYIKTTFPELRVFVAASEESNAYLGYGEINSKGELDNDTYVDYLKELEEDDDVERNEDDDDYYDRLWEQHEFVEEQMWADFTSAVNAA